MAILTRQGRAVLAAAIKAKTLHMAWGTGDGAWTTTPLPEDADATGLTAELGRRTASVVEFVVPDVNGIIEIAGAGTFSVSTTPTNKLYIATRFDFTDEPLAIIREIGLFVDTVTDPDLPAGQRYFTPDQIVDPGELLQLEHKSAISRSNSTRESFDILIVF